MGIGQGIGHILGDAYLNHAGAIHRLHKGRVGIDMAHLRRLISQWDGKNQSNSIVSFIWRGQSRDGIFKTVIPIRRRRALAQGIVRSRQRQIGQ